MSYLDVDTLKLRLTEHLSYLARERDPYIATGGYRLVQQYIQSCFEKNGTVETHHFSVRGQEHTNWILKLPGNHSAGRQSAPILVSAHYDAVPGTPGADDNASGLAVLLELASYISRCPSKVPIWFVAFDMEEYGLLGSQAYGEMLKAARQPLRLMIALEMVGYCDRRPHTQQYPVPMLKWLYPQTGNFIGLVGNLATIPKLNQMQRHIRRAGAACEWLPVPGRGQLLPSIRRSDYASFRDLGYPATLITDTSFLRNPHYHQSSDRLETLDLEFMTSICQGLITWLSSLR